MQAQPPETFLRLEAVSARIGLRRSAIYNLVQEKKLAAPLKIGRASVWRSSDVDRFMDAVIEASQTDGR